MRPERTQGLAEDVEDVAHCIKSIIPGGSDLRPQIRTSDLTSSLVGDLGPGLGRAVQRLSSEFRSERRATRLFSTR